MIIRFMVAFAHVGQEEEDDEDGFEEVPQDD
jgi:hypothetical protein